MRRRPVRQRTRCHNQRCNERLVMDRHRFCPSCRYMARRTKARLLPIAIVLGGLIWGIIQKVFL